MNKINCVKTVLKDNEAAIILSPINRYYLTGIKSSDGVLFITKSEAVLYMDSRYFEMANKSKDAFDVVLLKNYIAQINEKLDTLNIKKTYIESDYISLFNFSSLKEKLNTELSENNIISETIKNARSVKNNIEIDNIIKAQEITDKTFEYILNEIKAGKTEKEIMLLMEYYSRSIGSECPAFDFIVVSGKNSSMPHGVPTDKKIEYGDFITMDFGATVNGYRSDMTRTVAIGKVSKEQEIIYNTVLLAQKEAIKEISAGKKCSSIDKTARDIISNEGFGDYFGHALGHSVGLDIHEDPVFSPRCEKTLQPGNIMTVEPGIYIQGKYGVRIEDMVIVTESGCIDITKSKKELIVL
ncbi:MAG: aminopeptidase P family protein [Clostridia bacterium]|nr:aminopeptidase P family protein [Clostridia bacterium]